MCENTVNLKVKDVLKGVTLKIRVSGLTEWSIRTWIGMKLIWLAAHIMWIDIIECEGLE